MRKNRTQQNKERLIKRLNQAEQTKTVKPATKKELGELEKREVLLQRTKHIHNVLVRVEAQERAKYAWFNERADWIK